MNEAIKKEWVDALRSGQYKQGTGWLCKEVNGEREYCCLGVLTDLAIKNGIDIEVTAYLDDAISYDGESEFLPEVVMEWAEIRTRNGEFRGARDEEMNSYFNMTLTDLNDAGEDFVELADYIEKYL